MSIGKPDWLLSLDQVMHICCIVTRAWSQKIAAASRLEPIAARALLRAL